MTLFHYFGLVGIVFVLVVVVGYCIARVTK